MNDSTANTKHKSNNQKTVEAEPLRRVSSRAVPARIAPVSISRDEMNLAEFPLAVLSTRVDTKVKTLEFTDYSRGAGGEMIERRWIITGADKFGLPTATDDDVVLGLIRLTMDQGFRNPKVYFTRYELLKTLRWSTEGRSYQRLVKSLDRLSGVRIRSSNSFYDNSSKSYQTSNFGIIDAYEINDERVSRPSSSGKNSPPEYSSMSSPMSGSSESGLPRSVISDGSFETGSHALSQFDSIHGNYTRDAQLSSHHTSHQAAHQAGRGRGSASLSSAPVIQEKNSFFIWSEMLFDSFKSGYIKKLDLDLYFSLKSAVSRRLYRYLDKHFYFKNVLEAHLFTLAFEKIGLSRTYKYVSSIRQQLTPALKELVEKGFLDSYEFHGDGQAAMIRFIAASSGSQSGLISSSSTNVKSAAASNANFVNSRNSPNEPVKLAGNFHSLNNTQNSNRTRIPRDLSKQNLTTSLEISKYGEDTATEENTAQSLKMQISPMLIERGILERQVKKLLLSQSKESLHKIIRIISYFDELVANSDRKVSINPVGFLYRAVESPYKISLPEDNKRRQVKASSVDSVRMENQTKAVPHSPRSTRPEHKVFRATRKPNRTAPANDKENYSIQPEKPEQTEARELYRAYIQNELNCIMTRMSPIELGELFAETENKMRSLKKILQPVRFQEAIEACVRDELRRRFCLPTFEKWIAR